MKRNPWPYAIVLYFVIFIAIMASWIAFAVRNDDELVRADYYEHELQFQSEIDRVERGLAAKVNLSYDSSSQTLSITLPPDTSAGTIFFYRPSDSKLDREISLALTEGAQILDIGHLQPGLWKLRLTWIADKSEFRYDRTLVL